MRGEEGLKGEQEGEGGEGRGGLVFWLRGIFEGGLLVAGIGNLLRPDRRYCWRSSHTTSNAKKRARSNGREKGNNGGHTPLPLLRRPPPLPWPTRPPFKRHPPAQPLKLLGAVVGHVGQELADSHLAVAGLEARGFAAEVQPVARGSALPDAGFVGCIEGEGVGDGDDGGGELW